MGQVMVRPLAEMYWLLEDKDMLRGVVESWLSGLVVVESGE